MVNADSDEGERSSERSDGCRSVSFHLDTHGSSLSYSLWCTCTKRDEGLWSLWAALAPSTEGSVPSFVEKEKRRNLLLTKQIAQRGEGGIRREEGYHD